MQPITLYPINPEILAQYDMEELIPQLAEALKTPTQELQELSFTDNEKDYIITYTYKVYVSDLSLTKVDPILETIIHFWDYNRIDDSIQNINLDYTKNLLTIVWNFEY